MSGITAATVLDTARGRHPKFFASEVPDGVLLQAIDARQRTLVLRYAGAVDGLINTTVSIATVINGALVGQVNGAPVFGTTFADGWPVHQDANGAPFVNFTEQPIAGDPFGERGGVPGFPLPTDFLKLILASVVYANQQVGPLDIVSERTRLELRRVAVPTAFISGNRLVPVRPLATGNSGDVWASNIIAVQLSYVALPAVVALTDAIVLPAVLHEAMIAGIAEVLAYHALGVADRASFSAQARTAEEELEEFGVAVIGGAQRQSVAYRRY